ncbi:hypothetical protein ACH470_41315 [Streptomyces bottropensis]|uniref:hypothetical protein n=1 Tax=Streptomyces bottropensis TaxID=42235 RepID=UPI0037988303
MKYTLTEQQAATLRQIAAASSAVPIAPKSSNTAWALEQRGLIKRSWRGSGHVAVVTSDGRYFLKHGKHPKEVQAEKERLAGDAEQAERAPADGAQLIARLQSATTGKLTVPDPGPQTRGRWRTAFYDALHHDHVPGELKLRWTGRQRGDCVFTLVDEEAEKAAQPPPVPTIDVPDVLGRPHQLVRATRKALGRSKTVVDTRGTPEVIPLHVSREQADRALRIMHALLTEAESRGYQVETRTDLHRGQAEHQMVIVIRGHALPLAITEQTTKVPHEPTAQEIRQQQRNPWTRIPKYDHEFNGRLELGAPAEAGTSIRTPTGTAHGGHWSPAWGTFCTISNSAPRRPNADSEKKNSARPSSDAAGTRPLHRHGSSKSSDIERRSWSSRWRHCIRPTRSAPSAAQPEREPTARPLRRRNWSGCSGLRRTQTGLIHCARRCGLRRIPRPAVRLCANSCQAISTPIPGRSTVRGAGRRPKRMSHGPPDQASASALSVKGQGRGSFMRRW